jgi:hypothetical protein
MKRFGEKARKEARNRVLTNRFICYCGTILSLASVCLFRGFPYSVPSNSAGGSTTLGAGDMPATALHESPQSGIGAPSDGYDMSAAEPARGPPVKIEFTAASSALIIPVDDQNRDSQPRDSSQIKPQDNYPRNVQIKSGEGDETESSTGWNEALDFVEASAAEVNPEANSTAGPLPVVAPIQSIPEPDSDVLLVLGGLITAWWKMHPDGSVNNIVK